MLMAEYVEACDRATDFDGAIRVCSYCDIAVVGIVCSECGEYDGLITIVEWEDVTGEEWVND